MSNIPFVCRKCEAKAFNVPSESKTLDDFDGATCQKCGAKMTKNDIEAQARNIAFDALKKAGFKIN
jgi:hypothetical protein